MTEGRQTMRTLAYGGLAMLAGLAGAWAADLGAQLKGDDIVQAFVGHKLEGVSPKGEHWSALYNADGSANYGDGSTGKWHVKNALFCDQPAGGKEACRLVMKLGDKKYQMMREDGTKGSLITAE
jgi:hypothetical protein